MTKDVLAEKIDEIDLQTKKYLTAIKERLAQFPRLNEINLLSYFTYSLNISHDMDGENLCLGTFHIKNVGNQPITNPYICIKLPKESPFTFTGKYIYKHATKQIQSPGGWERLNDKENKEEFWLKPLEHQSIAPNETITFSDFQIKWQVTTTYGGTIQGYTYSDQNQDGIPILNPINLSGVVPAQEDRYDR